MEFSNALILYNNIITSMLYKSYKYNRDSKLIVYVAKKIHYKESGISSIRKKLI